MNIEGRTFIPLRMQHRPASAPDTGGDQFDWMDSALCAQVDPDLFILDGKGSHYTKATRAVCAACPVAAECLQHALDLDISDGLYGGLTAKERRRLRPAGAHRCPDCDKPFDTPSSVGPHRSRVHGYRAGEGAA